MKTTDTFIISKAGYKYSAIFFGAVVLFSFLDFSLLRFLSLIALGFVLYIYRNPELELPSMQKGAFVSPAEGKVVAINSLDDGYEIVIETSLLDISILRAPFPSNLQSIHLRRGSRLSTDNKKSALLNEKVDLVFEDRFNNRLHVEHMLEGSIDALTIYAKAGEELSQGRRYGVMTKGKTTIRVPLSSRLSISVDSLVKSGETLLGYFS